MSANNFLCLCSICNIEECVKKENRYVARKCHKCTAKIHEKRRKIFQKNNKYQGCLVSGYKTCKTCKQSKPLSKYKTEESRSCNECSKQKLLFRKTITKRIIYALKRSGQKKKYAAEKFIGCTIEFLKTYLESKFTNEMSWDNRGFRGWHIDHIRPLSSFDLSDVEQQKQAFHYTNLQPLWWQENFKKGSKWQNTTSE